MVKCMEKCYCKFGGRVKQMEGILWKTDERGK